MVNHTHMAPLAHPPSGNVLGHDDAVQRFSQLLKFQTVSNDKAELHIPLDSRQHFHDLLDYLPTAYPVVWSACKVEMVRGAARGACVWWELRGEQGCSTSAGGP